MSHSDWFERASVWPHRHQVSNGVFLDGPRRWRGGSSIRHGDGGRPAPSGEGEPDLSEQRLGGVDAVEQACRTSSGVSDPSNVSG
jgi:hypothetical protein